MFKLPGIFLSIPYNGSMYPGHSKCRDLSEGANCQTYVYEILRAVQPFDVPNLRSSEFWEDTQLTEKVTVLEPLDVLLFNRTREAYGSHMGLYVGNNKVLHLSAQVGFPAIWDLEQFNKEPHYRFFIGAKRLNRIIKEGWEVL